MSDFVHDPTPTTAVINGPEGSSVISIENSDLAHRTKEQSVEVAELQASQAEEMANLNLQHAEDNTAAAQSEAATESAEPVEQEPAPVPYRASTPESDKANVEQLFKEGKITEEQMNERFAEIDAIAADPTLSPQEPEPEPTPEPEPPVEPPVEGVTPIVEPPVVPEPEVPPLVLG